MEAYWYVVNVEAAVYRDGRWLLIERGVRETHAAGTLSLIGGKIEDAGTGDDILENTLRREVREEVAIEVTGPFHYVRSTSFIADDHDPVVDIVLLCRYDGTTEPHAVSADEVASIAWLSLEDALKHPKMPPWTRRSLALADKLRASLGW